MRLGRFLGQCLGLRRREAGRVAAREQVERQQDALHHERRRDDEEQRLLDRQAQDRPAG